MRALFVTLIAAILVAGCGAPAADPKVTVEEVWVQLPVIPGRPGAAYFTLRSDNDPTKLVDVSSPKVERIELHGTRMEGGTARMAPLTDTVFEGGTLEFKPGGNHAMLFGIDPAVKAGDKVPLTFRFEPLPAVTVEAEVRAFGAGQGDHAGH